MTGFTDLHNHCLWGMDDGAQSFEESCRMLQAAAEDGITTLAATVHVYPGLLPFHWEEYLRRLEKLRQWVKAVGLPLTLLEGAEIWYTDQTLPMLRSGRIPTLDGSCFVLVEFSPKVSWKAFEKAVWELFRSGYIPVIAHVERYRKLYRHTSRLIRLRREIDICFQVNTGAILAPRDPVQRFFLNRLLCARAVDLVATDAHGEHHRPTTLRRAYARLEQRCGQEYAAALTGFSMETHLQTLCKGRKQL